jgi:hypothetical protein
VDGQVGVLTDPALSRYNEADHLIRRIHRNLQEEYSMTKLLKLAGVLLLTLVLTPPVVAADGTAPTTVYPIIDPATGFLLGGTINKLWIDAGQVAPLLKGNEPDRLYSLNGYVATVKGTKPESAGAPCEETQVLTTAPAIRVTSPLIGSGGPWGAYPRVVRSQSTTQPVYLDAVAAVLKENGIANPRVRITQLLRVDLDGDGMTEVVLTASSHVDGVLPSAEAGDYSLVLLRKVINGQVQTTILDGDFYTDAVDFAAPNDFKVTAIADLNGDGNMDIAVHGEYYEGAWTSIYEVKGSTVKEVLLEGCGA